MRDEAAVLTVVGSIDEDTTISAATLPAPGETVLATGLRRGPGGKGANQAAAAARLAGSSRLVGAVGTDEAGGRMLAELQAAGVDVGAVQRVEGDTGQAFIVVDGAGKNCIAVVPGANDAVTAPTVLTVPVLCQLELPLHVVLAAARVTSGYFALNAAPAKRLPPVLIDRCDLIVVNQTEYAATPELVEARLAGRRRRRSTSSSPTPWHRARPSCSPRPPRPRRGG